jgi:hypothetical protein
MSEHSVVRHNLQLIPPGVAAFFQSEECVVDPTFRRLEELGRTNCELILSNRLDARRRTAMHTDVCHLLRWGCSKDYVGAVPKVSNVEHKSRVFHIEVFKQSDTTRNRIKPGKCIAE